LEDWRLFRSLEASLFGWEEKMEMERWIVRGALCITIGALIGFILYLGFGDMDGDGLVALRGDCNDVSPAIYPGATEICDDFDNDCDGVVDEDLPQTIYYDDTDGDGYGDDGVAIRMRPPVPAMSLEGCYRSRPGMTPIKGDCDDTNPLIHPGAIEISNGIDDDCDGETDE